MDGSNWRSGRSAPVHDSFPSRSTSLYRIPGTPRGGNPAMGRANASRIRLRRAASALVGVHGHVRPPCKAEEAMCLHGTNEHLLTMVRHRVCGQRTSPVLAGPNQSMTACLHPSIPRCSSSKYATLPFIPASASSMAEASMRRPREGRWAPVSPMTMPGGTRPD